MIPERWARIEEVFHAVLERPPEERPAFLHESCAGDEELRREVESLLLQAEKSGNPILHAVSSALQSLKPAEKDPRIGQRVGPYRLSEIIGQGGMGTVYRARRDDDQYRIEVAVKVVKRGMDTDHVLQRFRQERQILAALEHPNIARLLEGGTTGDGLPYFVMEYIEGVDILQYCKQKQLSITERLRVFQDVCLAVHHAHQRLIIHRDIKPANLLVTPDGIPKLLDFGIAKLLNPDPSEETPTATMTALRLMTPDYASPEQVLGLPISTATDVYSLGAVLYELLTERRAHQIKTYTPTEIEQVICRQQVERPSMVAARSSNASQKLSRILQGDLDNIILMAMRKEPERRYQSPGQLAEDLNRYLRSFPVIARADTLVYRAGKFVKRNKWMLLGAAVVILSLVGGILSSWHQARRAERRFQEVRKLANSLFEFHDKIKDLPGSTEAREMIVNTALQYLDSLAREARGDSSLQWELAEAYLKVADVQGDPRFGNVGHPKEAIESYRKSFRLIQELRERDPANLQYLRSLAKSYYKVGDLQVEMGDIRGGMDTLREGIGFAEMIHAQNTRNRDDLLQYIRLQRSLGDATLKSRNPAETLRIERRALQFSEEMMRQFPDDFSGHHLAFTLIRVGEAEIESGDLAAGIETYKKTLQVRTDLVQRNPSDPYYRRELRVLYIWLGNHYGGLYTFNIGDRGRAEQYYRKALTIAEQLVSEDPKNAAFQHDLAVCYAKMGEILSESDPEAALPYFEKGITINEKLREGAPDEFRFLSRKALFARWMSLPLRKLGETQRAMEKLRVSVETLKLMIHQKPTNPEALSGMHDSLLALAHTSLQLKDFPAALDSFQKALEMAEKETAGCPEDLYAKWRLADSYAGLGSYYEAMARRSDSPRGGRMENFREAAKWYGKSHAIWMNWSRSAVSTDFDRIRAAESLEKLSRCEKEIASADQVSAM